MQIDFINLTLMITTFLWLTSLGYLFFSFIALELFKYKKDKKVISGNFSPPVTILKPIYGLDPGMLNCLRSFCQQDYPKFQVIFGLQDENDPAIPFVKQVIEEFSNCDISFIINTELHGTNHKVSNLINMNPYIKYEYLLIADSDMRVSQNYLSQVMEPFSDEKVGVITCLSSGRSTGTITSKLNAMFINTWFLPSVLISRILQPMKYCLGATMIVKRGVLSKIGGFESLSNHLADDYILGKLISSLGATETYPFMGSSEIIADITSTGKTLEDNNLRVLKDGLILKSSACILFSKKSLKSKKKILLNFLK